VVVHGLWFQTLCVLLSNASMRSAEVNMGGACKASGSAQLLSTTCRHARHLVLRGGDSNEVMQDMQRVDDDVYGKSWNFNDMMSGLSMSSKRSLMVEAIKAGNLQDVQNFVRGGISLNEAAPDLSYQQTFVHLAARCGNIECLRLVLELGGNVSVVDSFSNTPLHIASVHGHIDAVMLMIESGANMSAANKQGLQPIHMAASNGHVNVLQTLILMGANVSSPTSSGSIPLRWSSVNGHVEASKLLLRSWKMNQTAERGINPCYHRDKANRTVVEVVRDMLRRNREKNVLNRRLEQILSMLESFAISEQLPPDHQEDVLMKDNNLNLSRANTSENTLSNTTLPPKISKYSFLAPYLDIPKSFYLSQSSESVLTSGSSVSAFHHHDCGVHKDPKMFSDESEMQRRYPSKFHLVLPENKQDELIRMANEAKQYEEEIDKQWEERIARGQPGSARTVDELDSVSDEFMDEILYYPTLSQLSEEVKKDEYKEFIDAFNERCQKGSLDDFGVDPMNSPPVNPNCFTMHDFCVSRLIGSRNSTTYPYIVINETEGSTPEPSSSTPTDSGDEWAGLKKEGKEARNVEKQIMETFGRAEQKEDYNILHKILQSDDDEEEETKGKGDEENTFLDDISSLKDSTSS